MLIKTIANMNATRPASKTFTCLSSTDAKTRETIRKISDVMLPDTSALVTGPGERFDHKAS